MFLGYYYGVGFKQKILGTGLNKTRRNSNWEQRPLTHYQVGVFVFSYIWCSIKCSIYRCTTILPRICATHFAFLYSMGNAQTRMSLRPSPSNVLCKSVSKYNHVFLIECSSNMLLLMLLFSSTYSGMWVGIPRLKVPRMALHPS